MTYRATFFALGALAAMHTPGYGQADADPASVEPARELVRQWVETERLISREAADWQEDRERMTRLLDLYAVELERLTQFLSEAGSSAEGYLAERDELTTEMTELRNQREAMARQLDVIRPRMVALGKRLPMPLRDELEVPLDQVATLDAVEETQILLQAMATVVTATAKFDRVVTVVKEIHPIGGGEREVDVMYLGLARAYFVAGDNKVAGVGVPGANGWKLEVRDGIANSVRQAIAVKRDSARPELVTLPLGVTEVGE